MNGSTPNLLHEVQEIGGRKPNTETRASWSKSEERVRAGRVSAIDERWYPRSAGTGRSAATSGDD